MIAFVNATVLTIGLNNRDEVLRELPIRLIKMQSAVKAARSLKTERIDSVISKWDLDDMRDGEFLRRLRAVKPTIPTIVLIKGGDISEEIAARSLGVSAVLSEEIEDEHFLETVAAILGLAVPSSG